jgi:hypothetical protein
MRSSGESSGRSSRGRVGHQLGHLGPLTGQRASSRPDPLVGDGHEPGRWGSRGTHVSHAVPTLLFPFLSPVDVGIC